MMKKLLSITKSAFFSTKSRQKYSPPENQPSLSRVPPHGFRTVIRLCRSAVSPEINCIPALSAAKLVGVFETSPFQKPATHLSGGYPAAYCIAKTGRACPVLYKSVPAQPSAYQIFYSIYCIHAHLLCLRVFLLHKPQLIPVRVGDGKFPVPVGHCLNGLHHNRPVFQPLPKGVHVLH